MSRDSVVRIDWAECDIRLELEPFARACGVEAAFVNQLVEEGLVRPDGSPWCFGEADLARVRRIRRLQRDFDADLQSVAVMVELLDEIDRLRRVLRREGLEP